ncbi:MAG: hypothetical protein K6F63_03940 [Lachnospiraceae bacterium]|nr:hypothetical protein [Lachnospiraceae bacterium]
MSAKEYLNRIRILDFQIQQKEKQIADARDLQGNIKGFDYSGVKVQTSSHGDATIDLAVKIMTLEQELTEKLFALQTLRAKIIDEIASLDNETHIELLTLRYCHLEKFELIALDMNMSFDRIRHLHGEALKNFQTKVLDVRKDSTQ